MNKENFKNLYEAIYSITVEISNLIELDNLDSIQSLLDQKDDLIKMINESKSQITLSNEEKLEINSIILKIKETETKNLESMEKNLLILKERIANTNKEYKALSSYQVKQDVTPSILDKRE